MILPGLRFLWTRPTVPGRLTVHPPVKSKRQLTSAVLLALMALPAAAAETPRTSEAWAAEFYTHVGIVANLVYEETPEGPQTLDIYQARDAQGPAPTVFFIHGGAWIHGTKEDMLGYTLPWMEMGWTVVNINYRVARQAPAPAALLDCACALRWTAQNAQKYRLDLKRLVIAGASAGGELALVVAMAPSDAGIDPGHPLGPLPRAAAVVNFSGVTDVLDLLEGPHRQGFTAEWLGGASGKENLARRLSPVAYVRPGAPPVFTAHGDADSTVPYEQAVRLHRALSAAGVANELWTITGGRYGAYTPGEYREIYSALCAFLAEHHLPAGR
jgi:acetyl esterase/lipase